MTSMTIKSGDRSEATFTASTPSLARAHHLELLGPLQNHLKTFPRDRMVVGEQHPYTTRLR